MADRVRIARALDARARHGAEEEHLAHVAEARRLGEADAGFPNVFLSAAVRTGAYVSYHPERARR